MERIYEGIYQLAAAAGGAAIGRKLQGATSGVSSDTVLQEEHNPNSGRRKLLGEGLGVTRTVRSVPVYLLWDLTHAVFSADPVPGHRCLAPFLIRSCHVLLGLVVTVCSIADMHGVIKLYGGLCLPLHTLLQALACLCLSSCARAWLEGETAPRYCCSKHGHQGSFENMQ